MSRSQISCAFAILAALALAIPLAARTNEGKKSKSTASASLEVVKDTTIAGKQVKAGRYDVKANESTLTLSRDGKVVAQAPITWKDEPSKATYSAIVVDGGAVKEVHFNGKTRFAELSEGSMASGQ
jgi:hypothetical protein